MSIFQMQCDTYIENKILKHMDSVHVQEKTSCSCNLLLQCLCFPNSQASSEQSLSQFQLASSQNLQADLEIHKKIEESQNYHSNLGKKNKVGSFPLGKFDLTDRASVTLWLCVYVYKDRHKIIGMYQILELNNVIIAVKGHHCNFYKENMLFGWLAQRFRGFVHYHDREHGGVQTDTKQKEQLHLAGNGKSTDCHTEESLRKETSKPVTTVTLILYQGHTS